MSEVGKNLRDLWGGASRAGRIMFVCALVAMCALGGGSLWWSSRSNDQVLFSHLDPRDAAAVVGQLKRMKVPYRIGADGTTILVDSQRVRDARLSLLAQGVPSGGGVGFEIFDNQDVGMTESLEQIDYQRALQGELARTIMGDDRIRSARVHLVLEGNELFSRDKSPPKAAVSLVLKSGAHLTAEQVFGIQRLVAGAVRGLDASRVTITDQDGILLTGDVDPDSASAPAIGKLRMKQQTDEYLTRKVSEVLERAFGPGQAIVSVDATLDFDESKRTEHDILPLHGNDPDTEAGAVVSKRESIYRQPGSGQTAAAATGSASAPSPAGAGALTSTSEVEYALSRSAEQTVSTPGTIRRISVGVIVRQPLDADQLARVRQVVGMAIGFDAARGDAITVQPLSSITLPKPHETASPPVIRAFQPPPLQPAAKPLPRPRELTVLATIAGVMVLLMVMFLGLRGRQRAQDPAGRLSSGERQELLVEIQAWIAAEKSTAQGVIEA